MKSRAILAFFLGFLFLASCRGPETGKAPDSSAEPSDSVPGGPFTVTVAPVRLLEAAGERSFLIEFETTYPAGAVLCLCTRRWRHDYAWPGGNLTFGAIDRIPGPCVVESVSENRVTRTDRLHIPTRGVYDLVVSFNPMFQTQPVALRRRMGRSRYFYREFPAVKLPLGASREMIASLKDETGRGRDLLSEAGQLLESIENESGGNAGAREKLKQKVSNEMIRLQRDAAEKDETGLLSGTYHALWPVLQEMPCLLDILEAVKQGNPAPRIIGVDGKPLHVGTGRNRLQICEEIRRREYVSWLLLSVEDALKTLSDVHGIVKAKGENLPELRAAYVRVCDVLRGVGQALTDLEKDRDEKGNGGVLSPYPVEGVREPQMIAGLLEKCESFAAALSQDGQGGRGEVPEELRTKRLELEKHFKAARVNVLGGGKPLNPP